jgi:hypothetical protein
MIKYWRKSDDLPPLRGRYIEEIEIEYENDLGTFHAVGLFHDPKDGRPPVFIDVLTGTKIDWSKTVKRWRYYAD